MRPKENKKKAEGTASGVLELKMGDKANKEWGAKLPPPSAEKIN